MTKTIRNKANREQTKENILNAAIIEFSQHGYLGASTQGIAKRAGMSKSQLHYYIEDKETLYHHVLERLFSSWTSLFDYDSDAGDTPSSALRQYITMKLKFALTYPELSRIFTMEVISNGTHLAEFWPDAISSALQKAEIINCWVRDGKIRQLDGRLLIMNIWALTQYYADYALQTEKMMNASIENSVLQNKILEELVTFVLNGCGLEDN